MAGAFVSVIIPAFNAEKYIAECLDSVLHQSYDNMEILVIDDGSVDATPGILDSYSEKDTRVSVIHKPNEGVSEARNRGLMAAKGDYIAFVDADDLVSPVFVQEAVEAAARWNADIVLGNTVYFKASPGPAVLSPRKRDGASLEDRVVVIEDIAAVKKKVLGNGREKNNPLNGVFTSGPVCKLFRASAVLGHRFPRDLKIGEDTVFNLEVLDEISTFAYVRSDWYYYRLNSESATGQFRPDTLENAAALISRLQTMEAIREPDYTAYLQERTVQQLSGVLSLMLRSGAKGGPLRTIRSIREIITAPPWSEVLRYHTNRTLPGNIYDRGLLALSKRNYCFGIYIWAGMREHLLKVRDRKNAN